MKDLRDKRPDWLETFLIHDEFKNSVENLLKNIRRQNNQVKIIPLEEPSKTEGFMDDYEIFLTDLCHVPANNQFESLMKKLHIYTFDRAIDVGCGDGRFTYDYLDGRYKAVDMFDIDGPIIK